MKKILKVVITLIIIFLLLEIFKVQNIVLKNIYPLKYSEYVEQYAKEYNVDKNLIYAIIKAESNFNEKITSNSGACGTMQIMENTAVEVSNKIGIKYTGKEMLYDAKTNIELGTAYFSTLLKNYNDNVNLALAAYNAGMGNVTKWINTGVIKEDGSNIENIPFKETNNYVRKILRDYKIYQKLYEKE